MGLSRVRVDHGGMHECGLCGGTVTTCAACKGSCASPVCHVCRDSDPSRAACSVLVRLPRRSSDVYALTY